MGGDNLLVREKILKQPSALVSRGKEVSTALAIKNREFIVHLKLLLLLFSILFSVIEMLKENLCAYPVTDLINFSPF